MKTLIITFICAAIITATAYGQGYYSTDTIRGDGFEFKCDCRYRNIRLYNAGNPIVNVFQRYKDGSRLQVGNGLGYSDNLDQKWADERMIISGALTAAQKEAMRASDEKLALLLFISPETGRILTIDFQFDAGKVYGTVPPATYYLIEQRLKANIVFNITTYGARLNYVWSFVEYRGE